MEKSIQVFLSELNNLDIKIWIEGNNLKCNAPKGKLTPELRTEISKRKEEIIRFLQETQAIQSQKTVIKSRSNRDVFPLSFPQQRLWFLDQLEGANATYNMPGALRLEGKLNKEALEKSLNQIINRHESLRTRFKTVNGEAVQIIDPEGEINLEIIDLETLEEETKTHQIQTLIEDEGQKPFNLSQDRLIRGRLIKLGTQSHILLITMHHIISDGWSIGVLVQELTSLYSDYLQGIEATLEPLKIQYADFAAWQREWLAGDNLEKQLDYWKQQLSALPPLLELPTDKPRPPIQTFNGSQIKQTLNPELSGKLKQLSQKTGVTLFMTLLSAFSILLSRYSRQEDLAIGSPIANRNREEIESLIGFFVNTLVMRVNLEKNPTVEELLKQVRSTCLEAYSHQDVPFEKLVEEINPERNMSHSPLFQVMFVLQNTANEELSLPELSLSPVEVDYGIAKFDLTLSIEETEKGLVGNWEYNSDLFERETIERMMTHFQVLLEGIVENPQEKVAKLPLLSEAEKQQILVEWNDTVAEYPKDKCIHQLFEEQVERTPNAVAVVYEEEQLTYQQLNQKANQLAHYLQKLGVKPDTLVGICVERSLEMVIGLLGILKAGGAYVPIDPNYPRERIEYMLEDSSVSILLTQEKIKKNLPKTKAEKICLDRDWLTIALESENNVISSMSPDNLAYVIYTSGSTGKPKGVMIKHGGLSNLSQTQIEILQVNNTSQVLQFASFSFDASTWEIVMALSSGARLCIVRKDELLPGKNLEQTIQNYGITHITLPPSALTVMSPDVLAELETIVVAGEACLPEIACQWSKGRRFLNGYGPTEDTVCVTIGEYQADKKKLPIGRPLPNQQVYLLDNYLQPIPVGVTGELYIGGIQLAKGYLNRPELTAQKFIPNPFGTGKLYKTGDLCCYLPDGNIEYIGRIDHQVKIRGFRIELGEIEAQLSNHSEIRETVVIAREDTPGNKQLVAYIVSDEISESNVSQRLRDYLKEQLPDYMIPSAFVLLDKLPLTPNGKIDRKALPAPDWSQRGQEDYIAPQNPTQELLANIWQTILKIEKISLKENFFELGGHSLLATQIISRVRETFSLDLPIRALFEHPTLEALAQEIENSQKVEISPIVSIPRTENLPLSFPQQRLWFLDQLEGANATYNMPGALRLKGNLNLEALEKSLNQIIQRHESLRTRFSSVNGEATQIIDPEGEINLEIIDLETLEEETKTHQIQTLIEDEGQKPFNLSQDRLIRGRLIKLGTQSHILLITMHHIISDGWSIGVLVQELTSLYSDYLQGIEATLEPLKIQYADFAAWQREWLAGDNLEKQLDYWKQQLSALPPLLELPTDKPRPPIQTFNGSQIKQTLNPELSGKLKQLSQKTGVTLFMTLLSAFSILLSRYSRQEDLAIGSPIANRNREEIESLIGFFVNTLVMRVNLEKNPTVEELLKQVRSTCLEAYSHQDVPFEKLVEEINPERNMSHSPLFQVMFVLQNTANEELSLPELSLSPVEVDYGIAKFDLTLSIEETEKGLVGNWEYNSDLFERETIERMMTHFQVLLEGIVENPQEKVVKLPLLSEAEKQQILVEWNDTVAEYPKDKCIHQLFEEQVERTPNAVAVVYEEEQLTYQQLNQKANQLAHYLQKLGVKPDTLVGICVERSLEMVIGLLGILKAGGAYVPIDPNYPRERIEYMLEDSGVSILLTQKKLTQTLPQTKSRVISWEKNGSEIDSESNINPNQEVTAGNLAYVIYTSGSTGRPKGAMNSQQGVVNRLLWMQDSYNLNKDDKVLQKTPFSFDVSVWEFFWTLGTGASLIVAKPEGHKDSNYLRELIEKQGITTLHFVPSMLQVFLEEKEVSKCHSLKRVICSGEALPFDLKERFRQTLNSELYNLYGPTEAAIDVSYWNCHHEIEKKIVPIGRPVANTQLYILDPKLAPVPVGIGGELHIGGVQVGKGYLNRPELTDEKFIPNLFGEGKLYKTGDLCRYLPDGNIEYIGRIDHQVKIRGFRIELGEIESLLTTHPDIRETVVIAREDKPRNKQLVAYIVSDVINEGSLSQILRDYLKEKLPDYMVPSAFVLLEKLPLTPNGKVNRKALPSPDYNRLSDAEDFVAPQTQQEIILAQIWSDLLQIDKISIHSNFFELGGDSIISIQVVARTKQAGLKITPKQLFENQTIASLALVAQPLERVTAKQGLVIGNAPLTPIQYWFFEQDLPEPEHWNQAVLLEVDNNINVEKLEKIFHKLLEHHDALRLRFKKTENQWKQDYDSFVEPLKIKVVDITNLPRGEQLTAIETIANQGQSSLNIAEGPMMRVVLFKLGNNQSHRLLIIVHHLAVDGISWRILLEDLANSYQQFIQGKSIQLQPKTTSYDQWGETLIKYAQSEAIHPQLEYWLSLTNELDSTLPLDYQVELNQNTEATVTNLKVTLSTQKTQTLLQDVPQVYNTQINDILLTALVQSFSQWTGKSSIFLELEGHGREDLFEGIDLSRTVGWFTSIFPVHLELSPSENDNLGEAIKSIKEQLRQIPQKGIGYGILRYLSQDKSVKQQIQQVPKAQISFNYLGQLDQMVGLSPITKFSTESVGLAHSVKGKRQYLIDINSMIVEEQLEVIWTYSNKFHKRETIEQLADNYLKALQTLINHCKSPQAGGFTPSDFPDIDLDQQELDDLLAEL